MVVESKIGQSTWAFVGWLAEIICTVELTFVLCFTFLL